MVFIDKQWEHNTVLGDSCSGSAPDSRIQNIFLFDCLKIYFHLTDKVLKQLICVFVMDTAKPFEGA